MSSKHSKAELKRLMEKAVVEICGLPRPGLWFCVDEVKATGAPPDHIQAWATLHFSADGSPFCCGEPSCHLGIFPGHYVGPFSERNTEVSEHVRRAMHLRQKVSVEFQFAVQYHEGVSFHSSE